jgi:hypothetical protein
MQDWGVGTLSQYLTEQNNLLEGMLSDVESLIHKIAVDLGSYPFPADVSTPLTCNRLLIFVGLCTRSTNIQDSIFIKSTWISRHTRRTRHKQWNFHRLLFQSMSNSKILESAEVRSAADEEDLIDVLQSCRPGKEHGWEEEELIPTIAALPSSRSKALGGVIKENDLRLLLQLLVSVALRSNDGMSQNDSSDFIQDSTQSLLELFEGLGKLHGNVDWDCFSAVITKQLVSLQIHLIYTSTHQNRPIYLTIFST